MPTVLISIYHGVFLAIFCATAVVALGAITRWGAFANVPKSYTKILATVLIVELIGAVILTYRNLPPFEIMRAEEYLFRFEYRDYVGEWRETLNPPEKTCIKDYDSGRSSPPCEDVINEYISTQKASSKIGVGSIFLSFNTSGNTYSGMASYTFPGEHSPTAISVKGYKKDDNRLKLNFTQPTRVTADTDGKTCKPRDAYTFTVEFERTSKGYTGGLSHPQRKSKGEPLKMAEVELVR